jgi:hypothetical protein
MNFKTVYDLATEKVDFFYKDLPTLYLFLITGIGLLIFYNRNRKKIKTLAIGLGFIFISSIGLLIFLVGQYHDIDKAKQIIKNKTFFVVEGVPENFHPMPKDGHGWEEFDINGVDFAYSDYMLDGAGYKNTSTLGGGVIVPNKYYRLTYYTLHGNLDSNKILKIEIRK